VRETTLQKQVLALLKTRGAWTVKVHSSGRNRAGTPDIIGCYLGFHFAIELKTDRGRPTALQIHELLGARQAGSYAIVARSKTEVERMLDAIAERFDALGLSRGHWALDSQAPLMPRHRAIDDLDEAA
jgi:Holliday junction resolvase